MCSRRASNARLATASSIPTKISTVPVMNAQRLTRNGVSATFVILREGLNLKSTTAGGARHLCRIKVKKPERLRIIQATSIANNEAAFIRFYADDKTLELIISLPDLLRRELSERWI